MDKKLLANAPSLSCVEGYFICKAQELGVPEGLLYSHSYVGIAGCIQSFLSGAESYEHYSGIKRIQDAAEDYGLVKHKKLIGETLPEFMMGEPILTLVEVNPAFLSIKKRTRGGATIIFA